MKRFRKKEKAVEAPVEVLYTLVIYGCDIWWITKWAYYIQCDEEYIRNALKKIKSKAKRITIGKFTFKRECITAYKLKEYEPSDR